MTRLWNLSWIWSYSLTGAMLLVVTIDRLIAVYLPLKYFKFTTAYAFRMCALTYGVCILQVGTFFVGIFSHYGINFQLLYLTAKLLYTEVCTVSNFE